MLNRDLEQLSLKFDELQATSTEGHWDDWFSSRFRMKWLIDWPPFHKFYVMTYDRPFASELCYNEDRWTYSRIKHLLMMKYLQSGRTDDSIKICIDKVEKRLQETPKPKKKQIDKNLILSTISVILMAYTVLQPYSYVGPFLLLFGVLTFPLLVPLFFDRIIAYFFARDWHKRRMKKSGIVKLRNKIIENLISSQ